MSGYALTPLAKEDIFEIWSFIASGNEEIADRVEQAIYEAFASLPMLPCAVTLVPTSPTGLCVSGR